MLNFKFKSFVIYLFITVGFFSGMALWCGGQDITDKIENYANRFSPEKAYLHYDKSAYSSGETIWFKAYLLNEITAARESKNFYIDWIDDKGNLLQHTVSPLVEGLTNGQFDIPVDYKGSFVSVKAYTSWMLNFDSSFLYRKTIPILNKDSLKAFQKIVVKPAIEFFPEGGNFIAGVQNKIAFKATDQWGRPVKIKGVVTSADGKMIDSLRVQYDGMGYVILKPGSANEVYTAKWKDEQNISYTTQLPKIIADGAALQVGVSDGRRSFQVNLSNGIINKLDSVFVVGTMFQHPVFKIAKSAKAEISGVVPTANLPYGVLTITVFDKNWEPLSERITYIDNNAPYIFAPEMEVQHWGLSYRARNEIKIKVPDNITASLSVSVTDLSIGGDSTENIISRMMLSSELKGRINNPVYYFTNPNATKQKHLDLVMLTNGWRRFNWQQIVSGTLPKINYPKDTAYLTVSGSLQGVMPGSIGNTASVMLIIQQKKAENKIVLVPINRNGYFNDPSLILFDTAQIYYQLQDKSLQGASLQFMPYKLRVPRPNKNWVDALFPDTTGSWRHLMLSNEFKDNVQRSKFKELEAVTIQAKSKSALQVLDEKYATGLFSGDGIQFDVVNDQFAKGAGDIFMYLQGKVAGLQITGQGSNASLSWRGGAPQIYLDEVPADVSMVSSVNINDVAYIKAFRPPFMGGFNGGNGAIAIYTRRGNDVKQEKGKGLEGSKVYGYSLIKEFYTPKYYSADVAPGADRDVRTTLYWNPNVVVDPSRKEVLLTFYNNDVTDAFRVVIEGMTLDGKLAHLEERME